MGMPVRTQMNARRCRQLSSRNYWLSSEGPVGLWSMQLSSPTHFVWTVVWLGWANHLVFYTRRNETVIKEKSSQGAPSFLSWAPYPPRGWLLFPELSSLSWHCEVMNVAFKENKAMLKDLERRFQRNPLTSPQRKLSWVWLSQKLLCCKSEGKSSRATVWGSKN